MDEAPPDQFAAHQPQTLEEEIALLRDDLAAAGLPVAGMTDVASPAGVRRLRDVLRRTLAGVDEQVRERTAELNHADAALRQSAERFRTVTEASPVGIFVIQHERFVYVNEEAVRMSGYSRDELLHAHYTALIHPNCRTYIADYQGKRLAGEPAPDRYEMQFVTKQGEIRWGDCSPRHITFNGQPAIIAIVPDITERKQIEAALQEREMQLRLFIEYAPVAVSMFDTQMRYLAVSERWKTVFGVAGQSIIGRAHYDMFPEIPARWKAIHRRALAGETLRAEADAFVRANGEVQWVRWEARPWHTPAGTIGGIIVFSEDITEQQRAREEREQLLAEVQRRAAELDATIAAIADGVMVYGPDYQLLSLNAAAERMLDITFAEYARPFSERVQLTHSALPDGTPITTENSPSARAYRGEIVHGILTRVTHRDGSVRWLSNSAAPIRTPDGAMLGVVVSLSDITPLRELQQRQEDLLHIVSHDLRIPLSVIHGHMELLEEALRRRQLDGELTLNTSTIDRNVQRMNLMIEDLVDMARLEGHQFSLTLEPVSLQTYLPDLIARLREVLPMDRVIVDIPPDLPAVCADYNRLERILLNLLSNAFKYSPADTPVTIRASRQGDAVVLVVSDQGRGIAPKDLPQLFTRFYRAGGERKAEGIGLGLYITKLLVEAHGGCIWVDSVVGTGSSFSFTLPLVTGLDQP